MELIQVYQWFFIFGGILSFFEIFFKNYQFIKMGTAVFIAGGAKFFYPELEPYQLVAILALTTFVALYLISDKKIIEVIEDDDNGFMDTKCLDNPEKIQPHSYKYKYKYNNNFH